MRGGSGSAVAYRPAVQWRAALSAIAVDQRVTAH